MCQNCEILQRGLINTHRRQDSVFENGAKCVLYIYMQMGESRWLSPVTKIKLSVDERLINKTWKCNSQRKTGNITQDIRIGKKQCIENISLKGQMELHQVKQMELHQVKCFISSGNDQQVAKRLTIWQLGDKTNNT